MGLLLEVAYFYCRATLSVGLGQDIVNIANLDATFITTLHKYKWLLDSKVAWMFHLQYLHFISKSLGMNAGAK